MHLFPSGVLSVIQISQILFFIIFFTSFNVMESFYLDGYMIEMVLSNMEYALMNETFVLKSAYYG